MRFLIIGAGGIGCYYGARLLEAGHRVTFVARGAHLDAMQETLTVEHEALHFSGKVDARAMDAVVQQTQCDDFDLIIVALKSGASAGWLEQCSTWLKNGRTPLLSLQNGVDNEPQIAECVGESRTLGGLAVRIGGHIIAPGQVEARGPAQVVMGYWPNTRSDDARLNRLTQVFNEAGIPTRVSAEIRYELWKKLVINNGVNPLSALTGLDTRTLTADPVLGATVYRMMQETAVAAKADDVELTATDVDEMFELISTFDAIKTSMLVDREKGRPLELDDISGAVIRRCEQLGQQAPWTSTVERLLRLDIRPLQWRPQPG
ncbi:ketopantoate reductase family protein [Marinobacterium litorale]|uniref:ketopantoate reductase family protein n=1 Tax=Marinobacterium litorale TaxID=404770 RepID=UPI0004271E7E|nr:2-dehydropantoate 2-reductase [Marinobacterium litorale]